MIRRVLDYYRQFRELTPEELSREARERRDRERALPVTVGPLDLSRAGWHQPPHPDAVNAATFALRGSIQGYPDPTATRVREAVAAAYSIDPERVVVGNGAAELLRAALRELAAGGEVALAWPGWGPLPGLVEAVGGRPLPVGVAAGDEPAPAGPAAPPDRRHESWSDAPGPGVPPPPPRPREAVAPPRPLAGRHPRALVVSRPGDPTGEVVDAGALAASLPRDAWLILDEALYGFLPDGADELLEQPRVLHVRSFSKAHAMAGMRVGYAVVPAGEETLAAALAPALGVGAVAQAGALWAVENGAAVVGRRRAQASRERERLADALASTPVTFPAGHGPYVWLASAAHDGRTLARHLAARDIVVAPGSAWGDPRHVRATLRDEPATLRLAAALAELP